MVSNIFDDFAPEPGIASGTVRVSDILAKGVPIRWDEAVALLQEILEAITTAGGSNTTVPAFEGVIIDREGAVTIQGTPRGERGPVAAGRALHALLATADIPVPLRLFVTQANAPETHPSLQAFAEGLAYFGKPGRADLIRAIFERYRTSTPATVSSPGQPATPPPLPQTERADRAPEPRRTLARWLMPAAVVFAVASLAAVIWLGVLGGGTTSAASAVTQAKAAFATVTPTIKNGVAPKTNARQPAKSARAAEREPVPATRARLQPLSGDRLARGVIARDPSPPRSIDSALERSPTSLAPTLGSAESSPLAIPTTREYVVAPRESEVKTIYSSADVDVEPPVMMYPSLPPAMFVARNADVVVVNRMELVIAADGSVERVRLVNGPTRMPDMMLLSGAKLWKFTPAVKDGVPVRYRTTVTWTGFP
jgi:hypothetical protein